MVLRKRSPKLRQPTPPSLGGGSRAGESIRRVSERGGVCKGGPWVRRRPGRGRSAPGRGGPVGLIRGLCGSTLWMGLWNGHVSVLGGGTSSAVFFNLFEGGVAALFLFFFILFSPFFLFNTKGPQESYGPS